MGKTKGIKRQFFSVLLTINILFVLSMVLFTGFYNQKVIVTDFDKSMTVSSKNLSSIMSEWMDNRLRELELYTNLNLVKSLNNSYSLLIIKNMNYEGVKSFDYFTIVDESGKVIATDYGDYSNQSKEDYFKSVMKGERVITFIDNEIEKAKVIFSVPIYNDSDIIIGMLSGVMGHDKVNAIISDFSIQEDVDILLSNNYGDVIYSNKFDDTLSHRNVSDKYQETKAFLGKDNISYINKYENKNTIYYFSKIEVTKNWTIVYAVTKSYIYENLLKNIIIIAIIAIVLIIMSFIFSKVISNRIAKPLLDLKNVFLQASTGDLYVRADESYGDEIGEANRGFNIMMDRIINMTYKDNLTGRTNYNYFIENLEKEIFISKGEFGQDKFAVMVLGVDGFKMINDSYGFDVGNEVLKQIAVLSSGVSDHIYEISRLGGDEFGILIKGEDPELDGYRYIKRLNKILRNGIEVENNKIYISVSAGISVFPDNGENPAELMKGSYIALNRGKDKSKGDMKVYSEDLKEELLEQVEISMMMMDGLKNNEFFLNYQPIISIETDEITSVEVLVRWESKIKGFISPNKFIPIAETSGQIIPLGKFVLFEACKGIKKIQNEVNQNIKAAINISVIQLLDLNFIKNLEDAIKMYDVPSESIILEITERVLMEDSEKLSILMNRIKRLGFNIALDDFGTGYSSLSYLSRYPVDILKIDQSFIQKLEHDNATNKTLVETMIAISSKMQIKVVAEGVETSNQLKILRELGCHCIQGYYISRPKELEDFINQSKIKN
ncbi:MAG: EAL domain-containing protein [Acidaminobacteraceae bacterium]